MFDIVVAYDRNYGIGKDGNIPWKLSKDMSWFRDLTLNAHPTCINAVIMGKNTWKSIGYCLVDRFNIIVTSDVIHLAPNLHSAACFTDALSMAYSIQNIGKIFVIGGGQLYTSAVSHPDLKSIYVSQIDNEYNCDVFFPYNMISMYLKPNPRIISEYTETDTKTKQNVSVKVVKYSVISHKWIPEISQKTGEYQYLDILTYLMSLGESRQTRNAKTLSVFGNSMYFDLKRFPLLTTKKVFFRGVFEELKFFLLGQTDTNILSKKGIKIWEPNTSQEFLQQVNLPYQQGDMGNMYGLQLRAFGCDYQGCNHNYIGLGIDQVRNSLELLIKDPASRRNIMTTFNPSNVHQGVLYPCHGISIQFFVSASGGLSCCMTQRSADIICGVPFNIASYALLVYLYCNILNTMTNKLTYYPDRLIMNFGDLHLYDVPDHIECAKLQIGRVPYEFPHLVINKQVTLDTLDNLEFTDLSLIDYKCHPAIPVKMVA